MQEKIIETKICKHCNSDFDITDKDLEFYNEISPVFNGKKFQIPTPTLCPDCRQKRRMVYRNESKLYRRKCDATLKDLITIYSPVSPYVVYDNTYWWSDNWDAMNFGIDFDFSKPFFEQFYNFRLKVPRLANNLVDDENTHFSNQCWHIKGSYLCFNVGYSEDCMYAHEVYHSKNIIDSLDIKNSEYCYSSFLCEKCFNCFFVENCANCSSVYFSYDCRSCSDIFMCSNLRNKKYCIRNKQYSREEYKDELVKLIAGKNSDINNLNEEFKELKLKAIHNENSNLNTENSTGDYLLEAKNCTECFNMIKSEDCKYTHHGDGGQMNCYDMNYVAEIEKGYEGAMVAGYNHLFGFMVVYGRNNLYCELCMDCEDCFACVGLRNKKYCIFNKQFTKEKYEKMVFKIIEHMQQTCEWGEFFPANISPFGYNETVAQEYFPLDKDVALQHLYKWSDYEAPFPKVEKIIPANKLPDNIKGIPDDILNWAIMSDENVRNADLHSLQKPFKIIKQELEFYRKHNLPIPRKHPEQRHLDRMKLRNERKLFNRNCDKCGKNIETTYSLERKEIVYCQDCYDKEIY